MYYVVKSAFEYAENSIESKRLDRYMAALDAYYTFVMEYPESKYKTEVDHMADVSKRFIEKNKKEE